MTETDQKTDASVPDLREKVIAAIKTVYDPEIPVDIYELGLIYEISVYPVNNVFVLMTLTSPSCPSAEVIPGEVERSEERRVGKDGRSPVAPSQAAQDRK